MTKEELIKRFQDWSDFDTSEGFLYVPEHRFEMFAKEIIQSLQQTPVSGDEEKFWDAEKELGYKKQQEEK
jgi:hypothetical protein